MELKKFTLKDPKFYKTMIENSNNEEYNNQILKYLSTWAFLMEEQLAAGKTLKEAIIETRHNNDSVGISGQQFEFAVEALGNIWIHGEEFLNELS